MYQYVCCFFGLGLGEFVFDEVGGVYCDEVGWCGCCGGDGCFDLFEVDCLFGLDVGFELQCLCWVGQVERCDVVVFECGDCDCLVWWWWFVLFGFECYDWLFWVDGDVVQIVVIVIEYQVDFCV